MKAPISVLLFALSALVAPFALHAEGVADWLAVEAPYARAVPPGQPNSAVFMILENRDAIDHALVAAASDAAEVVELHTHRQEGGMMRMRRIERIELPAGESVTLAPGGLHLMLIGLHAALQPGERIDVDLWFEDGTRKRLTAPVEAFRAPMRASGERDRTNAHVSEGGKDTARH